MRQKFDMVAGELQAARKAMGLSVKQFALYFGVANDRTVMGWETGQRNGKPTNIAAPVQLLIELAIRYPEVMQYLEARAKTHSVNCPPE